MRTIEIKYRSDEEYRRLWNIRDRYGVNWRWMLIEGAKHIQEYDLIGKNAPDYLEGKTDNDQSTSAWLDIKQTGPSVQRVDITDHDINFVQIEIDLVGSGSGPVAQPNTDPDAEPNPQFADTRDATWEGNALDSESEPNSADTGESAGTPRNDEETETKATLAEPVPEPEAKAELNHGATGTGSRQHGSRPKSPTTNFDSSPGGG